ncbi:MAG: carboxy terminal-processing peptidase [Candidatus Didemnitutus sp.]|nr:carboxy terminal-processing peptidase [Candidatus Didemnitutus sp.]
MRLRPLFHALCALVLLPSVFANTDRNFATNPLMQNEVRTLKQMLDYMHFNRNAVANTDYPKLITDYMALLDPQRLYFTSPDEQSLRRLYGPQLENDLAYRGNIDAAFRIFGLFEERVKNRVTWVHEQLAKDIDLTTDETYTFDRSKAPWPANQQEADELWMRRLKAELINELLRDKSVDEAKAVMNRRFDRYLKNTSELQAPEIQERFLTALMRLYDPHSAYFSAPSLEDFNVDINLKLEGIGAVLSVNEEGVCNIVSVVPGGPADLTGKIKPNDQILAVQQAGSEAVDVVGMRLRQVVQLVRGVKGTQVTLTIVPAKATDKSKTELVTVTRDVIKINQARASASVYEVPDSDGKVSSVGVISLNSFYGGMNPGDTDASDIATASRDVAELIAKLKQENIAALVIDLRRNGGGILSEAINLTGLFIDQGPVVQVRDSMGRVALGRDNNRSILYDGPLAVLTSRFSASASEIFAGALQNYGRAVVIGDSSTYGKGTVQSIYEMQNYMPRMSSDYGKPGAAKLTTQKYYLPNGSSTQKRGVVPDIALPSIDDFLEIGEAREPNALVWDEINSTPFAGKPLNQAFVAPLLSASQQRQQSLDEFALLKRNIDWFRIKTEQKTVSLNLEQRRSEKTTNEAQSKEFEAAYAAMAKTDFPKREIKLDAVLAEKEPPAPEPDPAAAEGDTDAADPATAAKFDVHLRETLRVVSDAVRLSDDPVWAKRSSTPTFVMPGLRRS